MDRLNTVERNKEQAEEEVMAMKNCGFQNVQKCRMHRPRLFCRCWFRLRHSIKAFASASSTPTTTQDLASISPTASSAQDLATSSTGVFSPQFLASSTTGVLSLQTLASSRAAQCGAAVADESLSRGASTAARCLAAVADESLSRGSHIVSVTSQHAGVCWS